jgi:HlyD family secretion protein
MPRPPPLPALVVLAVAACGPDPEPPAFQGYVEGESVHVAAPAAGWLRDLAVARGGQVAAGAVLFTLDATLEEAALAEARARLAEAEARLADLRLGSRPEEIAVIDARLAEALAASRYATAERQRQEELARRDVASGARLDQVRAGAAEAAARVERIRAELAAARLPARTDRIAAAEAAVAAARAGVAQAQWHLSQRRIVSPADALVEEVVRHPGEWVPANGTVASLLPPAALKTVFFVPEPGRTLLAPGDIVALSCDGCPPGLSARVSSVAVEAEYTPPVIYSAETRARLVYRAEAVPLGEAARLLPGQPVMVRPDPSS